MRESNPTEVELPPTRCWRHRSQTERGFSDERINPYSHKGMAGVTNTLEYRGSHHHSWYGVYSWSFRSRAITWLQRLLLSSRNSVMLDALKKIVPKNSKNSCFVTQKMPSSATTGFNLACVCVCVWVGGCTRKGKNNEGDLFLWNPLQYDLPLICGHLSQPTQRRFKCKTSAS